MTSPADTRSDQHGIAPEGDRLAALVASRICHDLAGPLGAIGNGVELLELPGRAGGSELELIAQSVRYARARARLLRLAFGAAAPGKVLGAASLREAGRDAAEILRLSVDWRVEDEADAGEMKLAMLLLMCLESTLPHGGRAVVTREGREWRFRASGKRQRELPELWQAVVAGKAPREPTAPMLHFAILPRELARQGRRLLLEQTATTVSASF